MQADTDPRSPGTRLTVVLRNDAPLIHCSDSPSYRTVVIHLSQEQEAAIMLQYTGHQGRMVHHESVSQLILEPERQDSAGHWVKPEEQGNE